MIAAKALITTALLYVPQAGRPGEAAFHCSFTHADNSRQNEYDYEANLFQVGGGRYALRLVGPKAYVDTISVQRVEDGAGLRYVGSFGRYEKGYPVELWPHRGVLGSIVMFDTAERCR